MGGLCEALRFGTVNDSTARDGTSTDHTEVSYGVVDHVATLTLNAPERMNTISGADAPADQRALLRADHDPDVRCIVLTGAGRAFCAGLDLEAQMAGPKGGLGNLGGATPPSPASSTCATRRPWCSTTSTRRPSARSTAAAGYGLDIALGCDIRIAADTAKLNPGFAKRGILPESGGTWLLPRMVGYAKAAEIAFTGRTLTADEALELGLVNHVVRRRVRRTHHGAGRARSPPTRRSPCGRSSA